MHSLTLWRRKKTKFRYTHSSCVSSKVAINRVFSHVFAKKYEKKQKFTFSSLNCITGGDLPVSCQIYNEFESSLDRFCDSSLSQGQKSIEIVWIWLAYLMVQFTRIGRRQEILCSFSASLEIFSFRYGQMEILCAIHFLVE